MADPFVTLTALLIDWEGPWHPANKSDQETAFGIIQADLDAIGSKRTLKSLTSPEAMEIFKVLYWDKYRCAELPHPLSLVYCDWCFNGSAVNATKALQEYVGAKSDGVIGPKTIRAVNAMVADQGAEGCVDYLISQRIAVVLKSTHPDNAVGLMRRIARLAMAAGKALST